MPPTFAAAAGQGLRAAVREAWLIPVGAVVMAVRRAALWPAAAVLVLLVTQGALSAAAGHLDPRAPVRGALAALASPRAGALVLGLALAGLLLSAATRVAWLSGALPTLGLALSGAPRAPRFAAGIAYGMPRVLAAALLGLLAELGAGALATSLALTALQVAWRGPGPGATPSVVRAGAGALALALALAVPVAASALADATVARAALRGEGPGRAFGGAFLRLLARPGSFVLAALAFFAAAAIASVSIEGMGGALTGFARDAPAALVAGPSVMLAALATGVSAALDVWWLGTIAALSCGEPRP